MAFNRVLHVLEMFLLVSSIISSSATARLLSDGEVQPQQLQYHHGPLLSGPIAVNLIWYGKFTSSQRAIVSDFITSLSSSTSETNPSVSTWWKMTEKYYTHSHSKAPLILSLGKQVLDSDCSLGNVLSSDQLIELAAKGTQRNAINVVLTAPDVAVEGFCTSRCGTHSSSPSSKKGRFAYIWVGNSATQCPGHCAWPFHQPIYGPQTQPLVAPNNDVGLDGMIVNLASLLVGTVTNPFGNGYFQGSREAPLEAATACPAIYGKDAYPGYAGDLLVDTESGASYNAHGSNGRKYLLPALWDPKTSTCSTLV